MCSSLDGAVLVDNSLVALWNLPNPLTFRFGPALNAFQEFGMLFLLKKRSKGSTCGRLFIWRKIRGGLIGVSPPKVSDNYDRQRFTMVRSENVGESFITSAPLLPPANY